MNKNVLISPAILQRFIPYSVARGPFVCLDFPLTGAVVAGNYTVEQSWDQMVVKFHNTEFYEKFWEAMMMRYKTLSWRHQQSQLEGIVQVGRAIDGIFLVEVPDLFITFVAY